MREAQICQKRERRTMDFSRHLLILGVLACSLPACGSDSMNSAASVDLGTKEPTGHAGRCANAPNHEQY
jgi:hypothetical protein